MKRLIILALVAAAAWYGWKNYGHLRGAPADELLIENQSGMVVERLRVSIGGTEYPAHDTLEVGQNLEQSFPLPSHDGQFQLHWEVAGRDGERQWSGGSVTAGPVRVRHHLLMQPDGGVIWSAEPIADKRK
jgi:hypothetical protein